MVGITAITRISGIYCFSQRALAHLHILVKMFDPLYQGRI